jgi:glycosyltransferase involved in cell wall biosynthesis
MTGIVIGIPTFRRPDQLDALLASLAPDRARTGAAVIVADNACEAAVLAVAERHAAHYRPVPERGLAAVRNALVSETNWIAPDWRWLVMLDDDGRVASHWLQPLVACGEACRADLVGGPVEGELPADAGRLARNSILAGRKRGATGPVTELFGTQNLLISRGLLARVGTPLFRTAYDRSGGEDYDLFRRATAAGARMAWCAEAVVVEPTPPEQLRAPRVLARYWSTGLYTARIDRGFDGAVRTWCVALKGLAGSVCRGSVATLSGDRDAAARAALMLAHFGGRVAGLLGVESRRYAAP